MTPSPLPFARRPALAVAFATALSGALVAPPLAAEWDGGVQGGAVVRDGESATRLRARLSNDARPLTHSLYAEWVNYRRGNGYRVGYTPRFWFDERLYAFAELEGRIDRPLLIERGLLLLGGVGYRVFDSATAGLGVEIGAGARDTRFETEAGGGEESEALGLLRTDAFREIADLVRLELDAQLLQGENLGELRAEAALAYRVGGGAVRVGYRLRRLSFDGGETIDDDDVSVSFTYGF